MIEKFYHPKNHISFSSMKLVEGTEKGGTYPVVIHRIEIQHIKGITVRPIPFLPLCRLDRTQIVRRVHITSLPPSRDLLAQIRRQIIFPQFLYVAGGAGSPSGSPLALSAVGYLEKACDSPAGGAVSGEVLHLGALDWVGEGRHGGEGGGR